MARIVYIYTSLGNSPTPHWPWDIEKASTNPNARNLPDEGFFYMWNRLIEKKVIDSCLSVVESSKGSGQICYSDKHLCVVMPHIDHLHELLRDGDIIVPRGGFRPWPPFLEKMNKQKRGVLFYRAATHRLKWPYWDVVLDDLLDKPVRFGERLHFPFNKPIVPNLFPFRPEVKRDFDLIINASHIHDKKGQWKAINALIAYRQKFGKHLRACLPGGFYGGVETRQIQNKVRQHGLDVSIPGMVPRAALSHLFSRSKIYIHLGVAGQNDRGVMEAMSSGCPVILANTQFHAPFQYKDPRYCKVTANQHDAFVVAQEIHEMLEKWTPEWAEATAKYYQSENGVENVVLPKMEKLLNYCIRHPVDREAILKEYGV